MGIYRPHAFPGRNDSARKDIGLGKRKAIGGREGMKDNGRAFPDCLGGGGMTLRQYAAVKLRVPRSGDPELDKWILESRRMDYIGQILTTIEYTEEGKTDFAIRLKIADGMLAEWEKEAGHEK
jgi:hypothetical protein